MINFVMPTSNDGYSTIYDKTIKAIAPYLTNYTIGDAKHNCVNIYFVYHNFKKVGTSVFIDHGFGCKNYRTSQVLKNFDYVIVQGEFLANLIIDDVNLKNEQVFIGGYPLFDNLYKNNYTIKNKTLIWTPTHTYTPAISSYPILDKMLDKISDWNIIKSPHPYISKDTVLSGEKMVNADVVVADCGSSALEAFILGKPVVFTTWLVGDNIKKIIPNSVDDYIYSNKIGYHANSFQHMVELIDLAYKNGMGAQEVSFSEKLLPKNLRGNSGVVTANILKYLSGRHR